MKIAIFLFGLFLFGMSFVFMYIGIAAPSNKTLLHQVVITDD